MTRRSTLALLGASFAARAIAEPRDPIAGLTVINALGGLD